MRDVSYAGDQVQPGVAVRNGVGDKLHTLSEELRGSRQTVFGATEDEGWRFDVRPVVHNRIEIYGLSKERLNHRQPRPVGTERPRVTDARVRLELRSPRGRVVRNS